MGMIMRYYGCIMKTRCCAKSLELHNYRHNLGSDIPSTPPCLFSTLRLYDTRQHDVGFACFFAGPPGVLTGESIFSGQGKAAIWLGILTACITTTVHTQDFRDVRGDRVAGRITVPLSIGDTAARLVVAVQVCGWTLAAS
jgi:hypothetical protein